ncbi:MAG: EAL domain-containing protein [Sulfuricurvum sp.]|nr:EAL domain-containing protein [Sulfuricurvum sp.]
MELSDLIQEMLEQCQTLDLLYVEDDQEIAESTKEMLSPFFKSITLAHDGLEGLEAYKNGQFDIVLTDIMMPKLDGRSLSRKIREINPHQAIIVISAFEEMEYFREFIEIGISKFVPKPPEFKHLLNSFISTAISINNDKKVILLTKELKKDLDENKELLKRIIDTVPIRIFWKDRQSRFLGCNRLFAQDAGLESEADFIGKTDYDFSWKNEAKDYIKDDQEVIKSGIKKLNFEEKQTKQDGSQMWLSTSKVPLMDSNGNVVGILGAYSDITAQKDAMNAIQAARDELGYQAQHDPLTDLPNRVLYMDRLNHAMKKVERSQKKLAVMFIDLDRFKQINDSLGHETGDKIVQLLAHRLSAILRSEDTVARFGGDEFTVLLEDITDISAVAEIAGKMVKAMDEPFDIDDHHLHLTLSAGVSIYPDDGDTAEILIRNADTAMYRAKDEGRNAYTFYNKEMTDKTLYSMMMAKNIRTALELKEFEVYYQPQIDAVENKVLGVEALIRWKTPNGFISPAVFIPIAEEAGLIHKIGEFVFSQATSQIAQWYAQGYKPGRVAINLSAIELQKENFVESIIQRLADAKCKSDWIELEITEGYTMKHADEAIRMLQRLKDVGIHLSIDDFGTGYSSLSYLQKLPIHKLKIDQSFVRDIPGNPNSEAIVQSIIFLAKSMQFDIIAEGVETQEQQNYLVSKGCSAIQGYYNAKPMPASQIEVFLQKYVKTKNILNPTES